MKEKKVYEWCIDCERPATYHCRACGLPICRGCNTRNDGMCITCKENYEDDDDDGDTIN